MNISAADELVPIPASGRLFGVGRRPGLADCTPTGRMRLDAMARWFQDVAWADIDDAGVGDHAFWILRRTRIRVTSFPVINTPYAVRTFCSGFGRLVAERRTVIAPADHPERALVDAVSLWVHLDPATRRPSNLTEEELAIFAAAGYASRRVSHRLKHPRPELEATAERRGKLFDWYFRRVDTDLADHVNNSAYWEPVEEELLSRDQGSLTEVDAELEFRDGAQPGPASYLRGPGDARFLLGSSGELLATVTLAHQNLQAAAA